MIVAFKGATHYEAQIGPLWVKWPLWRFLRIGCWPHIGWDKEWNA